MTETEKLETIERAIKDAQLLNAAIASIRAELKHSDAERAGTDLYSQRWSDLYEYSQGLRFALDRLVPFAI